VIEKLIRATPEELENVASDLAHALIHVRCSDIVVEGQEDTAEKKRYDALVALLVCAPATVEMFARELYSPHMDISQRLLVLEVMSDAARELATLSFSGGASGKLSVQSGQHAIEEMDRTWYGPGSDFNSIGASPWRQVHEPNAMVSLIHKYEREVPYQLDEFKPLGKARRWGHKSMELRREQYNHSNYKSVGRNNFVAYAGAFMLPIMRDYDKIQHGVDFLGRDFIVLGRLICMLGVCVECVSLQPEAVILASALLDMLRSR
jgi:telomere length regulation protein